MKILVLQLARLGDIYMTWPVLRGLRRQYPEAEITLVTRPRFEAAVEGLTAFDKHIALPTRHLLEPVIQDDGDVTQALARTAEFTQQLRAEKYDWILNLTFSPFSSCLTHAIASPDARVTGYTRFADGTFSAGDGWGHYFYAQVGLDRHNRIHVTDLFGAMAEVQFTDADWAPPVFKDNSALHLPEKYAVIHVGASDPKKTLPASIFNRALKYLSQKQPHLSVVLIGASNEIHLGEEIAAALPVTQVRNLVGKTSLRDIFAILEDAEIFVGCDSGPMHMASLMETPTLNISVGDVNFWETGPKASLSFILRANAADQIAPDRLGEVIHQLLQGKIPAELVTRCGGLVSYQRNETVADRFQWDLVQAIYMAEPYPIAERMEILQGAMKLQEINSFAMEQLRLVPAKGLDRVSLFLERAEEVIQTISRFVPELSPLTRWYQAEKIRIGPNSPEDVLAATLQVHELFAQHLRVYIPHEETIEEGVSDGTL
jgi:heptosyltransferase-3